MTLEYNWWVSGGTDEKDQPRKSTEIRYSNGTWGDGPELPVAISGHCVVQLQRDLSVVIGGAKNGNTYIFNWNSKVKIFFTTNIYADAVLKFDLC